MPKPTARSEIGELITLCGIQSFSDPELAILDEEDILMSVALVESSRYAVPRIHKPLSLEKTWWEMAMFDLEYDERHFKMCFRMHRENFWKLCDMLSVQPHFTEFQEPIHLQVGVTLYRLGTYGNGASLAHVASKFNCCEGSAFNFTERVIASLICRSADFIRWPNHQERKAIGESMAVKLLPKCIGFVDGTDVIFSQAPLQNKEVYWSRKKHYCMQVQIVCDPNKTIIDLFTGYPGSVHDAKVYQSSPLALQPDLYFSDGEFIIGDSAYALTETVIVPFRRCGAGLSSQQRKFNRHLSGERVKVEHTIGMLKGRFRSLTDLRTIISKDVGHRRSCEWVHACAILHNFVLETEDWEQLTLSNGSGEDDTNNFETKKKGNYKRQALLEIYGAMS